MSIMELVIDDYLNRDITNAQSAEMDKIDAELNERLASCHYASEKDRLEVSAAATEYGSSCEYYALHAGFRLAVWMFADLLRMALEGGAGA